MITYACTYILDNPGMTHSIMQCNGMPHTWVTEDGSPKKICLKSPFQRPLFRHYYKGTDAVVIVIDTADVHRLDELYCDVLKPALLAEELANSVFLFLANKKDLPDTIGMEDLATVLNLKAVKHTWSK